MTWIIEKHGNQYIIRATGSTCGGLCNAELSWDGARNHPMASVEFHDRVYWTFIDCTLDGISGFHIVNQHSRYTGWQLSWDGRGNSHPCVSVEAINSDEGVIGVLVYCESKYFDFTVFSTKMCFFDIRNLLVILAIMNFLHLFLARNFCDL